MTVSLVTRSRMTVSSEADNTESRQPSRTANPSADLESQRQRSRTPDLPITDVENRGSNRGSENIASETSNNILYKILYGFIYIAIHALPCYCLWRIRWIRAHFRAMMQPPGVPGSVYQPSEDFKHVLTYESKDWDSDEWSFGQNLTLSLWCPALLEMLYIIICM
jgi:hypothetical protein